MNSADWLESDLVDHLRSRGGQAPGGAGWDGILGRIEQRHRRRQRRRVAATAFAVMAFLGVMVSLGGRMGPAGGPVATEPAGPSAGGFPRLVLDVAGYQLEHASENPVAAQPPLLEVPAPGSLRRTRRPRAG